MSRWVTRLAVACACSLAASPAAADVSLLVRHTRPAMISGTRTTEYQVTVKSLQQRIDIKQDTEMPDLPRQISTIRDLGARKHFDIMHSLRIFVVTDLVPRPEPPATVTIKTSVELTGRTKRILGLECAETRFEIDLAGKPDRGGAAPATGRVPAKQTANVKRTGTVWSALRAPGAAEYADFMKAAARLMTKNGLEPERFDIDGEYTGMLRLIGDSGAIPLEMSWDTVDLDGQSSHQDLVVIALDAKPGSPDNFKVPAGYKRTDNPM
jgi:hypothetical protein